MASIHATSQSNTGFGSLLTRFTELLAIAKADVIRWRTYRETLAELEALSLRELDDLDLNPTDLPRIARESVYGSDI